MIKFGTLMMSCALLLAFAATGAEAQTMRKQKGKMVGQTEQVRPQKAQPAQMPQATSDRDKVSATGFHDKEQDEPTQERPNPLDTKAAKGALMTSPLGGQQQAPSR
ncbi:MAG: hypothetical protein PHV00_11360 [Syntrophales bacterium]|nr:hypothetical protein [Syntrophales bacterium]HPJ97234.1 hypothetical protein [Syntrophales bacterium]